MSSSTLIEVFGHIIFSFTRDATEHYNPEEPEFTAESFGYNPLESTGREWHYPPVDEIIYQEYSDKEATGWDYLAFSKLEVRVMDACSPEDNEETQKVQQNEGRAMAWKQFRPSALRTICKSMYIGASISLIAAPIISTVYMLISYLFHKTVFNCHFYPRKSVPVRVKWTMTISNVIWSYFYYVCFLFTCFLLFRPHQLKGVKRKLFLVCCVMCLLDTLYRVSLQAMGKTFHFKANFEILLYTNFIISLCLQFYVLGRHFSQRSSRTKMVSLICKMATPSCACVIVYFVVVDYLYPAFTREAEKGKLIIALFAPLIGVVLKVISRICVQRLWNITHPGYSYVLLAPLYFASAFVFRVLQAELGSLQSMATLGIIHCAAEVIERSTMVVVDHICHLLWKGTSAPWGSFRTPRRERLMADIAIMSMLSESTAIVSVNGVLYLYQFIYLQNNSGLLKLLKSFSIHFSVQLVVEWFFTSVSLAIETRYQNMAVMAVWRRRWKRHILLAIICAVPLAMWCNGNFILIVDWRFNSPLHDKLNQSCKMPFT